MESTRTESEEMGWTGMECRRIPDLIGFHSLLSNSSPWKTPNDVLTKVLQWICSNFRNLLFSVPIHNCIDSVPVRFGHGLRLLHGGLKAGNGLFDGEGRIQFADFRPMPRDGGFSREDWSPRADVSASAMLLFEIVAGYPSPDPSFARGEVILPPEGLAFVSEIIG
jgi:hypothetical protein